MSTEMITLDEIADLVNQTAGVRITPADLIKDPSVTFASMAVDSLGVLGVVTAFERRFGLDADSAADPGISVEGLIHYFYQRLADGGQLEVGRTKQAIVIDAPYELVWDITNDVASWPRLFTEYATADILEQSGDRVLFRLSMHPDAEGRVWSWVSERFMDPGGGAVSSRRVETGPFEFMYINWTYHQVDGGVELRWAQEFAMKPEAPVDTKAMTVNINANSVIQLAVIRQRLEERAAVSA
jgi:aromatase